MKDVIRLGEALVSAGFIDDMQLQSALGHQRRWGGRLGKSLVELGFMDEATLIKFLSEKLRFPAVDLSRSHISPKAFESLPKKVAEKYMAVPILIKNTPGKKTLVLAMADPTDLRAIDEIEFLTNHKIEAVVALESSILKVLNLYGKIEEAGPKADAIMVEKETGRKVEFVQGDLAMLDEVRKADEAYANATSNKSSSASLRLRDELEPLNKFDAPPLQDFEVFAPKHEDDAPLEMTAPDNSAVTVADPIEDAEVVEEAKSVGGSDIAEATPADDDPYEYPVGATEEIPEWDEAAPVQEAVAETPATPVEEERNVSVVDSFEALEAAFAKAPDGPKQTAEAEPAAAPAEEADSNQEEPVAEAISEDEYVAEAEEAPNGEEAIEEAEYDTETVYEQPAEQALEAAPQVPPPESAEPTEQQPSDATTCHIEEQLDPVMSVRMDVARLAGKIEGLVSLFILHAEGKLSTRDFIKELKEL